MIPVRLLEDRMLVVVEVVVVEVVVVVVVVVVCFFSFYPLVLEIEWHSIQNFQKLKTQKILDEVLSVV